jgi:hypothetical protein
VVDIFNAPALNAAFAHDDVDLFNVTKQLAEVLIAV